MAMVADAITVPVHSAGDICTSPCVLGKLGRKKAASGRDIRSTNSWVQDLWNAPELFLCDSVTL